VIVGGHGRTRTPQLATRYADEFNVGFSSVERTGEAFERVRAACVQVGREPSTLVHSVAQTVCCGRDDAEVAARAKAIGRSSDDLRRGALAGTPDEIVDKIGRFAALGASRVYLQVLDLDDLGHLELIAAEVLPQLGSTDAPPHVS
jgi:alkanesulfonate monooxygenase SsuD/methylene tetrahydromethanopterin reductase-like flavin-dependent oxidoreductase (luciferase family)